jgi:hypothetical protein
MLIWTAHQHKPSVRHCSCMFLSRGNLNDNVIIEVGASRIVRHCHKLSLALNSQRTLLVIAKAPNVGWILNDYIRLQLVQSTILPNFHAKQITRICIGVEVLFRGSLHSSASLREVKRLVRAWLGQIGLLVWWEGVWTCVTIKGRLPLIGRLELLFVPLLTHFILF